MMKSFLIKSSGFLLLLVMIVTTICSSFNWYVGKKAYFKLNKNITSVVFGHSHSETAYNDTIITNFKNLSQSGESYFYTYIKAKQVFKQNPQIETVFIEFSNMDVTLLRDQKIWDDKYINWKYPIYSAWMTTDEHFFLLSKNPKSVLKVLPKNIKKEYSRIRYNQYNFKPTSSGYLPLYESKLDSLINTNYHRKFQDTQNFKESIYNLKYLEKLVQLCEKYNKKVYFIRSPLYQNSFYLDNEELFNQLRNTHFPNIEFLDLSNFPIRNDEFRDLNHVNYKGAEKISKWFNEWLQETQHQQ